MTRITFISDTHTKHERVTNDLPGGDILIHAGDIMNGGHSIHELTDFIKWFDGIEGYETKIFIAGNHDWRFEYDLSFCKGYLESAKTVNHLQDEELVLYFDGPNGDRPEDNIRIYGSPWQPEFFNWAFNLPRRGPGLASKWEAIPENTDILITHGPAYGFVDTVENKRNQHLGCELLAERIEEIKPKIHVCGHIHSGHGYTFNGHTHFFNASVLSEQYTYAYKPITVDWNKETNEIIFL
jgi:Icc-related predicted phosphoesterase